VARAAAAARAYHYHKRADPSVSYSRSRVHAGIVPPNLGNHSRRRVVRVGLVLDTELGRGLIRTTRRLVDTYLKLPQTAALRRRNVSAPWPCCLLYVERR